MKRYFSVFLMISCSLVVFAQTPESADKVMSDAYALAKKENKKVFVMFHASWCGWCHKMDASMNDASVKKFFDDNFVIRHLVVMESEGKKNLENPGAADMMAKYHGDKSGIPYWLVFDTNGVLLADSKMRPEGGGPETGDNIGCPATEKEVAYFAEILKKTTSLKAAELDLITKRFRQNEAH
ncbi:MAG TPA: thioredoxin family protein [Cyclobacteriaceae bacterium]|nr:thioredoxin family protein [Cyclobacteriaceae bacterium]HMV10145.1 thioredoxin family protein [Cyclobacteriaceae bacterium]HMV90746.1 thioredoxin family protein [Cyclobacteriaceae bacterium]HMX00540.1 thioredoxin family protein [Cyclobacteriaceae bacterium]HMX49585.1 thioredoxin family protein [Cyclobacteriaceae bacterium]